MTEFVFGSDQQYNNFKTELQDEMLHIYHKCHLPACCSKSIASIGFEWNRSHGVYILHITNGITCSHSSNDVVVQQFREWLKRGQIIFLDYNDMKVFLKGLRVLY